MTSTFSEIFAERQATRFIIEKAAYGDSEADLQQFVQEAQEGRIELPLVKSALKTIDATLRSAGEKPTRTTKKERKPMTTRTDVVEAVNRKAEEVRKSDPTLSLSGARARVWEENPQLASRYSELPPETPIRRSTPAKLQKGASTIAKVNEKAQELRKADPSLSPAAARSRIWETYPELAEEYRRASRS